MHPSVVSAWPLMAREHEGFLPFPYLDSVRKVTAGIGTLLDDGSGDPPGSFLSLPWTVAGKPATRAEAASAWHVVKGRTDLAPKGGWAFESVSRLRLPFEVASGLLMAKTHEFWSILKAQLPDLEEWPADAQLSLIDLAYQVGPRFLGPSWPNFTRAAHDRHFLGCAANCSVRQASPARNARRQRLFRNAALVVEDGIDPAILWDKRDPIKEDEDMAITEERLREIIREEIEAALPKVWDSPEVDLLKVGTDTIRPKTALERIARKVGG